MDFCRFKVNKYVAIYFFDIFMWTPCMFTESIFFLNFDNTVDTNANCKHNVYTNCCKKLENCQQTNEYVNINILGQNKQNINVSS